MEHRENLITDYHEWKLMTFYEKFEQIIALILVFLISIVIIAALYQLALKLFLNIFIVAGDLTEPSTFQALFGMIMTLLIAMEFKHSILRVVLRKDNIIQVKTVLLIAILAISRKFIILDTKVVAQGELLAFSVALLSLGIVYWLMRDQEFKTQNSPKTE